jgi:hypothetical protein
MSSTSTARCLNRVIPAGLVAAVSALSADAASPDKPG